MSFLSYSLTFAIIVTLASEFKDTYGLSTVQDGLCYMSYGFGAMSASFVARPVLDRDFAKVAEKQANLAATQGEKSVRAYKPKPFLSRCTNGKECVLNLGAH